MLSEKIANGVKYIVMSKLIKTQYPKNENKFCKNKSNIKISRNVLNTLKSLPVGRMVVAVACRRKRN
jgi:hypothetical protein